ncbi:hypothetical protein, partial [Synechocystis salina]|uniref:hypothetical protein n=1 Tax=Synechocystis salina TaxID=945780 RepID=UPI001D156CD8
MEVWEKIPLRLWPWASLTALSKLQKYLPVEAFATSLLKRTVPKYLKQGLADNITFFCSGRLQVFIRDGNNLKSVGLEHQNFAW